MYYMLYIGFGRCEIVNYLLDQGALVDAQDDGMCVFIVVHSYLNCYNIGGLIPLHNACSFGHVDVVQLLLTKGANPNSRDNWSFTPLHEAAIKGKADICIGEFYKV